MILKIIGSLIIIAATSLIGFIYSKDCSKRPQQLRELQGLLQIFENEISYLSSRLTDAFEKMCKSSSEEITFFFKSAVNYLDTNSSMNASEAWALAVKENIKRTALNNEDEEILVSFGTMLGNSDLEGQVKNIRLTLMQLKLQENKAEESRKKNEAMYKTLGILGGIAIVIILI